MSTGKIGIHPLARAESLARRAVDVPTRLCHALLALCCLGALMLDHGERMLRLHGMLGYTMGGLLVFRVLWGSLGPEPARRASPWHRLRRVSGWLQGLHAGAPDWRAAQGLAMALGAVVLLLLIALLALSGHARQVGAGGAWLALVHELLSQLTLLLALVHVVFAVGWGVMCRTPRRGTMDRSGAKASARRRGSARGWRVAGMVLAAVLGFWAWQWHDAAEGWFGEDGAASVPHVGESAA